MTSFSKLEKFVYGAVAEVLELRHGSAGDEYGPLQLTTIEDGVGEVMRELIRTRKRSDRADYLRTQLSIQKSKLKMRKLKADFEAETKAAEALSLRNTRRVDFESAAAIKADASIETFEERREAFEAKMALDLVSDGHAIIDKICYEFDSLKNDMRAIIKALQFESTLEH